MRPSTLTLTLALMSLGLATPAFADGMLERARYVFLNDVQKYYVETKKSLDAGKVDDANISARTLMEITAVLQSTPVSYVENRVEEVPTLKSAWADVVKASKSLSLNSAALRYSLNKSDPKEALLLSGKQSLSVVEKDIEQFGRAIEAAYGKFKDFGRKWLEICDTCR